MNNQRLSNDLSETDDDADTDTEIETNDLELDSLTDFIEAEDVVQMSRYTARRRIEELIEEQRLRKKMESYEDWD